MFLFCVVSFRFIYVYCFLYDFYLCFCSFCKPGMERGDRFDAEDGSTSSTGNANDKIRKNITMGNANGKIQKIVQLMTKFKNSTMRNSNGKIQKIIQCESLLVVRALELSKLM